MEEGNLIGMSPLRPGGSFKSPSYGKSSSPSFRRLRTSRRDGKSLLGFSSHCLRNNRVVLSLLLITLWAYAGFYIQSRWAHGDKKENLFSGGYGGENTDTNTGLTANAPKVIIEDDADQAEVEEIPKQNTTYGLLVGPFGSVEDSILEWSPERRRGTCDRKGAFARLVWSRKFVLIFHELSMTGPHWR